MTSKVNCMARSERMSLGYQSSSAPSASSAPSRCRTTMLLDIAFASTSSWEYLLFSSSISFQATSASQLEPPGIEPPSQPDISALTVISILSSFETVNDWSPPRSISNSSWSKLQLFVKLCVQASVSQDAVPISEPPAFSLIDHSTVEPLGPVARRNMSSGR